MNKYLILFIAVFGIFGWVLLVKYLFFQPAITKKATAGIISGCLGLIMFLLFVVSEPINAISLTIGAIVFLIHVLVGFPLVYFFVDRFRKRHDL